MKILFLLFELTLNFLVYLTPGLILNYSWKKWIKKPLFIVNPRNFYDRMLILTPYATWSLFYIFDQEQKTLRQMLFPDPLIIGFFTIMFLMLNHQNPQYANSAKIQWGYITLINIIAISCWYLISAMV